ncbi:signal peptidase 22kDa subunit [Morchella snyderi]|nr:signal peptidase 22kDa subunit [Morchella snyderi]
MHSSLVRAQNVFGFFTTVAFCVASLVALSSVLFPTKPIAATSVDITNFKVSKGRVRQYHSSKPQELATINFDLEANLEPLFNWNTKQVFAYVSVSYPGQKFTENEVVIWDRIVSTPAKAKINLKNQKPKYKLNDITGKMAERTNVTLTFHWNVQPHVGALTWGESGKSESITLPGFEKKVGSV